MLPGTAEADIERILEALHHHAEVRLLGLPGVGRTALGRAASERRPGVQIEGHTLRGGAGPTGHTAVIHVRPLSVEAMTTLLAAHLDHGLATALAPSLAGLRDAVPRVVELSAVTPREALVTAIQRGTALPSLTARLSRAWGLLDDASRALTAAIQICGGRLPLPAVDALFPTDWQQLALTGWLSVTHDSVTIAPMLGNVMQTGAIDRHPLAERLMAFSAGDLQRRESCFTPVFTLAAGLDDPEQAAELAVGFRTSLLRTLAPAAALERLTPLVTAGGSGRWGAAAMALLTRLQRDAGGDQLDVVPPTSRLLAELPPLPAENAWLDLCCSLRDADARVALAEDHLHAMPPEAAEATGFFWFQLCQEHRRRGRLPDAQTACDEGVRVHLAAGMHALAPLHHNARGLLELDRGRLGTARVELEAALDGLEALGQWTGLPSTAVNLALVHEREGRLDLALSTYDKASRYAERVCSIHAGSAATAKAALISVAFNPSPTELDRARRSLIGVRQRLQRGFPHYAALSLSWLGIVEHLDGQLDEAILHHDEARALLDPLGDDRESGRAAGFAALAHAESGDLVTAHHLADRAVALLAHREWHFLRAWVAQVQQAIADPTVSGDPNHLESRLTNAISSRRTRVWVLGHDGRAFTPPGGVEVDLSRRGSMARILRALITAQRTDGAGLDRFALATAGWPGQQLVDEAARSRVYTAVRSLRRLGLEPLLITREDGYLLDPSLSLVIRGSDPG